MYGTLRRACHTGAHQRYLQGAQFIGGARVRGQLFHIRYYPGLVLSEEAGWVTGEVYALTGEQHLQALDAYEECSNPPHPDDEYRRAQIDVQLDTGAIKTVWTYVYAQSTRHLIAINSGDFLSAN